MDDVIVPSPSSSALCALKTSHMTQYAPSRKGLLVVTYKFYTRQVLAEQVKRLSDEEVLTLGTVCLKR